MKYSVIRIKVKVHNYVNKNNWKKMLIITEKTCLIANMGKRSLTFDDKKKLRNQVQIHLYESVT